MKNLIVTLTVSVLVMGAVPTVAATPDLSLPQSPSSNTAGAVPLTPADKAQRKAVLLQRLEAIKSELKALDSDTAGASTVAKSPSAATGQPILHEVVVTGASPPVYEHPAGQTVTLIDRDKFKNSPAFSIGDVLTLTPGVTISHGNGPRDESISIRGSNERQTFGVRNIQMFEDGFPITQPDGLGRTDLLDPHAYGDIQVYQGPSSTLFGNYATGGAINFETRAGGDVRGAELGFDRGSFGYQNDYLTVGNENGRHEYMLFASHVAADGSTDHTSFTTNTEDLLATYKPTDTDTFTYKIDNNDLDTDLSLRLSLNQFNLDPYQKGCTIYSAARAAAGCASIALFRNGYNGTTVSSSADQADLGRRDRRTLVGARWEHAIDADTTWRTQIVLDNRDIKQPTGTTSAVGTYPSVNVISDLTSHASLFGLAATHYVGIFANYENNNAQTFNVVLPGTGPFGATAPGGEAQDGGLTNTTWGYQLNYGARAREELAFNPQWKGVVGLGVEETDINALSTNFVYPVAGSPSDAQITADRNFSNVAPEAALLYQPTTQWQWHARVATGYGTPQITNLFVTPQGTSGNNSQLQTQTNLGYELGTDWTVPGTVKATLLAFYERFSNELVNQSPGAGLLTYTFNAPHSVHRGVEAGLDWHPMPQQLPGGYLSVSYMFDQQYYTDYIEQLSAGHFSTAFNRDGNSIPGVAPQYVHLRLGYDQPAGELQGLGAFIEANQESGYYIDNANLVQTPSYALFNFDVHYDTKTNYRFISQLHFYFDVQNMFNKTYVASASNITDTISAITGAENPASSVANATGAIWAGAPRSFFGGVRLKF